LGPIPNPQSPIPHPPSPNPYLLYILIKKILNNFILIAYL